VSSALALEGELTIFRAADVCAQFKAALAAAEPGCDFELDLAGVTEMDSAGAQLLLALRKSTRATRRELRLVGHSAAVRQVFTALDLAPCFDDPLPPSAAAP
jgi:anti-anti-sigma factor